MCGSKNSDAVPPVHAPPPLVIHVAPEPYAQERAYARALNWHVASPLPGQGDADPRPPPLHGVPPQPVVWDVPATEYARVELRFGVAPGAYAQLRVYTCKVKHELVLFSHSFQSCVPVVSFYPDGTATLWHVNGVYESELAKTTAPRGGAGPDWVVVIGKGVQASANPLHQCRVGLLSEMLRHLDLGGAQVAFVQVQTLVDLAIVVDGPRRNIYAYEVAMGDDYDDPDPNEL